MKCYWQLLCVRERARVWRTSDVPRRNLARAELKEEGISFFISWWKLSNHFVGFPWFWLCFMVSVGTAMSFFVTAASWCPERRKVVRRRHRKLSLFMRNNYNQIFECWTGERKNQDLRQVLWTKKQQHSEPKSFHSTSDFPVNFPFSNIPFESLDVPTLLLLRVLLHADKPFSTSCFSSTWILHRVRRVGRKKKSFVWIEAERVESFFFVTSSTIIREICNRRKTPETSVLSCVGRGKIWYSVIVRRTFRFCPWCMMSRP